MNFIPPVLDYKLIGLTYQDLAEVNLERCNNCFDHDLMSWSLTDWTNALAGEVGEACNIAKKLRRGDYKNDIHKCAETELGKELADVVIYADLVAQRMGLSLEECVKQKFNEVSDRCDKANEGTTKLKAPRI